MPLWQRRSSKQSKCVTQLCTAIPHTPHTVPPNANPPEALAYHIYKLFKPRTIFVF